MGVLNAAGLAPLSLPKNSASIDKRPEPKKLPPFPFRPSKPSAFALASLSSIIGAESSASALSYEEALRQIAPFSTDFDLRGIVDGVLNFGLQNPLILAGGAAVVVVPLIASRIFGSSQAWGVETAKNAYMKLAKDAAAQLLDIREGKELRKVGGPDLRELKKKAVAIAYRGEDKPGFLRKLALKFNDPGNTTLFVLDKFDGNSELVAKLVTANGFKAAFAIKDGAEGPRGWMNSALPWSSPKKNFSLDFDELRETISGSFGENSDSLPVTFGLAAAAGLGLFAFTEIETLLQLVGSAAILQLITKKLLFAEDRKVTLQQLDEFLNTKVAPKELVDEIKMIGKSLLPAPSSSQPSLPAPGVTEVSPAAAPELNVESVAQIKTNTEEEAAPEPNAAINSVPRAEIEENVVAGEQSFLSPYPYYADFKPPSSPSPSQP